MLSDHLSPAPELEFHVVRETQVPPRNLSLVDDLSYVHPATGISIRVRVSADEAGADVHEARAGEVEAA